MTESAEQSLNRKRVNHASPSRGGIFSPRPSAGMINVLQRDRMGRHYRAIVNARGRSGGLLGCRESNGDRLAAPFIAGRTEEQRVGLECVRQSRIWWAP